MKTKMMNRAIAMMLAGIMTLTPVTGVFAEDGITENPSNDQVAVQLVDEADKPEIKEEIKEEVKAEPVQAEVKEEIKEEVKSEPAAQAEIKEEAKEEVKEEIKEEVSEASPEAQVLTAESKMETVSKQAMNAAAASYKVTIRYEGIKTASGTEEKVMSYTISANQTKTISAATINGYVKSKSIKIDGVTYKYESKWRDAAGNEVTSIVIRGAELEGNTELVYTPVYSAYPDKKVTVNFKNIYKADGTQVDMTESNTLSNGVSWSFTAKKLENKIPVKSFSHNGAKYTYTGKWINDNGEEVDSFSIKYADIEGDTEINYYPVYNIEEVKKLSVKLIDNISTGSGSWANVDEFSSYTKTFKAPSNQPHYQFINWENTSNGDKYVAGDKMTMKYADLTELNTEVNIYAIWQPSVTVRYHYNGKVIEKESFDSIRVYDQSLTIDGVTYGAWLAADGSKVAEDAVFAAPAPVRERTERLYQDVYAKRDIEVAAASKTWTYDGQEHSDNTVAVTGGALFAGDTIKAELGGSVKNVADGEVANKIESIRIMRGSKDVTEYYNIAAADGTLRIEAADVTLKSADLSKVYDGSELINGETALETETGWAAGEGASYEFTGSQLNAGESKNAFTYTLNEGTLADNYNITAEEGTLSVTPVEETVTVKITGNSDSVMFDGTEKTVEGFRTEIANELYTAEDFTFAGEAKVSATAVGKYQMGLAAEDFANVSENFSSVEFIIEDGSLEIKALPVPAATVTPQDPTPAAPATPDKPVVKKPVRPAAPAAPETPAAPVAEITENAAPMTENAAAERPAIEIAEVEAPLAAEIEDTETPLAGGSAWALINLICMILTGILSIIMLAGYFRKKDEEDEENADKAAENQEDKEDRKGLVRLASLIPSAAAIIAFIFTENMANPMVLTDRWTLLMAGILVIQALLGLFTKPSEEDDDDDAPAENLELDIQAE